jgi:putative MFS transporter
LGSFVASLVTDRFERKWCLVVFGTLIAVCGLLYGLTFNPILIVVFGFLVNMFERGYTALAYAYSPEVFDIRGRSLGTGVSYGLGRLSNAAGPLIIASLYSSSGYESVFIFIAGTWMVGAVALAIFGPATRRARLILADGATRTKPALESRETPTTPNISWNTTMTADTPARRLSPRGGYLRSPFYPLGSVPPGAPMPPMPVASSWVTLPA